jgi:hypothetical protein
LKHSRALRRAPVHPSPLEFKLLSIDHASLRVSSYYYVHNSRYVKSSLDFKQRVYTLSLVRACCSKSKALCKQGNKCEASDVL